MSILPPGLGSAVWKGLASAVRGSKDLARVTWIATLSSAEILLTLIKSGLVTDICRVKETLIERMEAETESIRADAEKRVAEAAEAASKADLPKRKDAIARAERDRQIAEAEKTLAEADAIRSDAETRRMQAMAEATAALLEAVSKLKQEGGDMLLSEENLRRILDAGISRSLPPRRRDE